MAAKPIPDEHALFRQIQAAKVLKESLKDYAEDDEIIRDMIEGETSLHEMIERVILSMDDDEIMVTGIKARMAELGERKARFDARIESKRAMVEQAMVVGEIQRIERGTFTVSTKSTPRQLLITDETEIPQGFWKAGDPKLDKKALKEALEGLATNEAIPGATLTNGGIGIQVRKK